MPGKAAASSLLTLAPAPAYQCYDCQGCGDCCRGLFAIRLTEADYARIAAQGWETDAELRGQELFTLQDGRRRLAHRADGSCVFLNAAGLCRIHAKFGEPAKPLACRVYPFVFSPVERTLRVDIRFDCPMTAGNVGRPITAYRAELTALLPQVLEEMLPQLATARSANLPPPPLFGRVSLPWSHLLRITAAIEKLLATPTLDLTRRVVAAVNVAAALQNGRLAGIELKLLDDLLEKLTAKVVAGVADDPLTRLAPAGLTRPMFRQLLAVYARADRLGQHPPVLQRLTTGLRMLRGSGTVPPLRPDFPAVNFADLEGEFGPPDAGAAASLVRYYRVHLQSMSFCGPLYYGRTFLDGLNMLLLTYPLACWFARAFAVAEGKTSLDQSAVERAIAVVDHQHGRNPLFNLASERYRQRAVTERTTLRSLVVWYGK